VESISQYEPLLGPEVRQAVLEYLDSGGWLTEFRRTREWEEALARTVGAPYCVATSSGTTALALALMALGLGPGDEVIVPDFTMIGSANAVVLAGARPVLVDVDPRTLCLDLEAVERALTSRTRAVMVVSLNGRAPDMEALMGLCQARGLLLVEDACQALGSCYRGRPLGTFGVVGCFSFSMPKVVTTGQGGAVVTSDPDLYERMRRIKDFGRVQAGVDEHVMLGYNFKFTDLQAVVGLAQLRRLPERLARKRAIYRRYRENLADLPEVVFPPMDLEDACPWFVDILVPEGKRDPLMAYLKEHGIGSRPFYPAIHTQAPYAGVEGSFPGAEEVSRRGLWLPSSLTLTDGQIDRVCEAVHGFFRQGA